MPPYRNTFKLSATKLSNTKLSIATVVYIGALAVTNYEDHYTSKINEPSTTTITIPVSTIPFPDGNENNEIHGIYTKIIIVVRYNN